MINVQVYYTTKDGVKKSRKVSYANPNADKVTLKEFIEALYGLTQNTIREIYRIDTAILLNDDSDDIVTPIVQEQTTRTLTLIPSSVTLTEDSSTQISASYLGDDALSSTFTSNRHTVVYEINGKTITVTAGDTPGTYSIPFTLPSTDAYSSVGAVLEVICEANTVAPPMPDPDEAS